MAGPSIEGHTATPPLWSRLGAAIVGPRATRRLAATHAVGDFSDSLITLSLIGSLFFSVSLEASRGRILLFLLLTVAPLAVLAPLVGPALDRTRAGYRAIVIGSFIMRMVFALLLASSLLSLAFYPLVFGILLSRKAYSLAKTAMITQLVPKQSQLVATSGHLGRTGTLAGGAGTALGAGLIALVGVEWLPLVAAFGFLCAATVASGIRGTTVDVRIETAVVRAETPVDVRRAAVTLATIHAAAGALTFLLALSIKRGGGDKWIFGAALVAAGIGAFIGTMVSPSLHRAFAPERVVALTLLFPGIVSAFGVLTIGSLSIVAIAFAIGLGGSVASRTMDVLYGRVPRLVRGRVISWSELIFQLANVVGAALAVLLYPGPRLGFAIVAATLIIGGFVYTSQVHVSWRYEAGRWLLSQPIHDGTEALSDMLLTEAIRFAEQGQHRVAVVVAESAVRVLEARFPGPDDSAAEANWAALAQTIGSVTAGTTVPAAEMSVAVIQAATALVAERSARSAEPAPDGPLATPTEPRPVAPR